MKESIWIVVWAAVIGGVFAWLWRAGHVARVRKYIGETRDELFKCAWPTWQELKETTTVVAISIALLGGFTVLADQIFFRVFMILKL